MSSTFGTCSAGIAVRYDVTNRYIHFAFDALQTQ
jgi:hypothetical protein